MKSFLRAYHIIFALVLAYTLGFLFIHTPVIEFFSYISNLVEILLVGIFLYLGLVNSEKQKDLTSLRGAVVVYIIAISLAFIILLENQFSVRFSWVSFVQHRLTPIVVLLEWILNPPTRKLKIIDTFKWLIFPTLYFIWAMIRGGFIDGWDPYRFFDPRIVGFDGVLKYFVGLLIGGWIISLITIFIGNKLRKK